jgi:sugar transferase (PEP-CTERM/EpsH1 system associated)
LILSPDIKNSAPQPDRITVGHVIYAFQDGGMERGLLNLINYGDRDRFQHIILCLTEAGAFAKLLASPSCTVIELHKKEGNDWRLPWRIAQVARQHMIDILHARGWPAMVETIIGGWLAGVSATMYTFHGKTFNELQGVNFQRRWVQRIMIRSFNRVMTLNGSMRADLSAECLLPEAFIQIIANGVDLDIFCPQQKRQSLRAGFNLPKDRLIVGNVARLDPVKNHEVILRALCRINKAIRPFFLLVGDGGHRIALQRQIHKLGLDSDVCLFGYSNRISELLNCMDFYVQSSLYEGFSNTVLEALACGLPILATKVGGTTDILTENEEGFFFQPTDDKMLASLFVRLLQDQELRCVLGEQARRRAAQYFPVQSMVHKYEAVYRDVVQENGSRRRNLEADCISL